MATLDGEAHTNSDAGAQRRALSMWRAPSLAASSGVFPAGARPCRRHTIRPVVLRRGRLVRAMMLLCLSEKRCQRRDVKVAESSSGKPRLDLLKQPAVAVWIAERRPREVRAALRVAARRASLRVDDLQDALEMEHLAHIGAACDEIGACRLDVVDDEEVSLHRARHRCREFLAEHDGARRAGRCHLHHAPVLPIGEIAVHPPPQPLVEALGAIDVGHGKDDDLELLIDGRGRGVWVASSLLICVLLMMISCVHRLNRRWARPVAGDAHASMRRILIQRGSVYV